jgi:hypothetical protein
MKREKVSRTPIFMISCSSFLGRLIESGPIKNYKKRDGCFVLDDSEYIFWAHTARNLCKIRHEEIQYLTGTN